MLIVPSTCDVGAADRLVGTNDKTIERVADMIAPHNNEPALMPGRHDAKPAGLEIER